MIGVCTKLVLSMICVCNCCVCVCVCVCECMAAERERERGQCDIAMSFFVSFFYQNLLLYEREKSHQFFKKNHPTLHFIRLSP